MAWPQIGESHIMKPYVVVLVVIGMLVVAVDGDISTAQAQPSGAGAAVKPKELVLDLGNNVALKLVQIPAGLPHQTLS